MARSLDLDALTEEDMIQLLDDILYRLPPQRLRDVRDSAEARRREKLEEAKNAVLAETREKLAALELTLEDVLQRPSRRGGSRRRRREAGQAAPVKYRSPEGLSWTGKGRVPQWLQAFEEQGRNREEFLVSQDEQEAHEI
jgi:DNA-binding protein H-NS